MPAPGSPLTATLDVVEPISHKSKHPTTRKAVGKLQGGGDFAEAILPSDTN